MFSPLAWKKWTTLSWAFAALIGANAACAGTGSAPSGGAGGAKIVISGALQKNFTPKEVSAVPISGAVGIHLNEDDFCFVGLTFPKDLPPGTHAIEDQLNNPLVNVRGEYNACGPGDYAESTYRSTGGKLTLTASGGKYSGNFEFTARNLKDRSKVLKISGSFENVSLP